MFILGKDVQMVKVEVVEVLNSKRMYELLDRLNDWFYWSVKYPDRYPNLYYYQDDKRIYRII